ncbi:MAG: hypothetical protein DRI57_04005 [Deltaproteobacteria bacterium]|nr:MAG: hypothetical protein DRI57_04005 [Deltaproteobacteria bacterium]
MREKNIKEPSHETITRKAVVPMGVLIICLIMHIQDISEQFQDAEKLYQDNPGLIVPDTDFVTGYFCQA